MRLNLTDKGDAVLEKVQQHCLKLNPNTEPALSTFLIQFLTHLDATLTKDQWSTLSILVTSERVKRKRVIERLLKLGERIDETEIEKFEKKIEKKSAVLNSSFSHNSAENS